MTWRSLRFLQLLVVMLLGLLLLPWMGEHRLLQLVFMVVLLNGVLVAVSASKGRGWLAYVLIGAALLGLALQVLRVVRPQEAAPIAASELSNTVVVLLCVVVILRYVFGTLTVTADTLFAAIAAYIFIAMLFSRVYLLMQITLPGSFGPFEAANTELELVYFSFVTIATLGYGDILPRVPVAKMVVVIEALVGQMYVAVLVAWLVSAHVARRDGEPS
jgi:hypothetical protein